MSSLRILNSGLATGSGKGRSRFGGRIWLSASEDIVSKESILLGSGCGPRDTLGY